MAKIPLSSKAKRPGFFADSAVDQVITMVVELMTELWVVKERVYALEHVLDAEGLAVSDKVNNSTLTDSQRAYLEVERHKYIATIMRSLEGNFIARADMQQEMDDLTKEMNSNAG